MSISGERVVLVDMDGVLADFESPNNDIIRAHFPDFTPLTNRSDFYFKDSYADREDIIEKIEHGTRLPGFFRNLPVVEGAIEGWQRILDAGYVPRICTSPLQNHDTVAEEKIAWLEEHFVPRFGKTVIDTAIIDREKSGYDAFAIIDDRPTLRGIELASWQHIVFTRSYNQLVETDFRVQDWFDPNLEQLLALAQKQYRLKR